MKFLTCFGILATAGVTKLAEIKFLTSLGPQNFEKSEIFANFPRNFRLKTAGFAESRGSETSIMHFLTCFDIYNTARVPRLPEIRFLTILRGQNIEKSGIFRIFEIPKIPKIALKAPKTKKSCKSKHFHNVRCV